MIAPSPIDDLAALLKIDRAALEQAVPHVGEMLSDPRMADFLPLLADGVRRNTAFSGTDDQLRAQILQYQASATMTDRERAAFFGLPEGCRIRERAKILAPEKFVNTNAQGGLSIGDGTQIGVSVLVWTHSSHLQAINGQTCVSQEHIVYKPTTIGRNCFIVGPSVISAGVTIGDGAMISPLTFVDRDVGPGEHVAGPKTVKMLEKRLDALEKRLAAREG